MFFFFQAEDGIRDLTVTGVQTCALPILPEEIGSELDHFLHRSSGMLLLTGPAGSGKTTTIYGCLQRLIELGGRHIITVEDPVEQIVQIGRASCRERV